MPVTTRAMSRLRDAESQHARKQSEAITSLSKHANFTAPKQSLVLKGTQSPVKGISPASSDRNSPQRSSDEDPPQLPRDNNPPQRSSDRNSPQRSSDEDPPQLPSDNNPPSVCGKEKSHQKLTETAPPNPPSIIEKTFMSCLKCPCEEGVFEGLNDSCVKCGHTMDDHELEKGSWNPRCDYLCLRDNLVRSILQQAREFGVVVIRATPMVGKTALLHLLGYHIVHQERDLEPAYLEWKNRESRENIPVDDYLHQYDLEFQTKNSRYRPRNPNARPVYLIDEAQGSYEEEEFWSMLKNHHNTRTQPLYILVCVYGAAGVSYRRDPNIESQAQKMHRLQRVELRPSEFSNLCLLFRKDEVDLIVRKFAIYNKFELKEGASEYIYSATDGHPGMVGLFLMHICNLLKFTYVQIPKVLSKQVLHKLLVGDEKSFVKSLSRCGRGFWSPEFEAHAEFCLQHERYKHIKILDIKKALSQVAKRPDGLTRTPKDDDVFAFCHKHGLLNTEQRILGRGPVTFLFPSPLHRRVAYRLLLPGQEPDAFLRNLSLQQICTNAIARFSPSTLQNRQRSRSTKSWSIPEAAFQDELYSCLSIELNYLPILSEYSHTKEGRIDFYVSDRKWGIEILQCGNRTELEKHIARFASGGNYEKWGIMDDYIILNFCPRSALRSISLSDETIQSHVFHVVIEPDEQSAEVYTHDKQLLQFWSLNEQRRRGNSDNLFNADASLADAENAMTPTQVEQPESERATMKELEDMRKELEEANKEREKEKKEWEKKKKEMEKEKKELKRELEKEKKERREKSRLRTIGGEDQEGMTQEEKQEEEIGKKRKRKNNW